MPGRSLGPHPRYKESTLYPDGGRTATLVWYKDTRFVPPPNTSPSPLLSNAQELLHCARCWERGAEEYMGPGASRQGQGPSGKVLSAPLADDPMPATLLQVEWLHEPGP